MKSLAMLMMVAGGLWALLGAANMVSLGGGQSPGVAAFGIMFNGALFVFPGLVVLGIGALINSRSNAGADAPGLAGCRTCRRPIAPDAPTCPHCGAPEPSRPTPAVSYRPPIASPPSVGPPPPPTRRQRVWAWVLFAGLAVAAVVIVRSLSG